MFAFELPLIFLLAPLPLLAWRWLPAAKTQQAAIRAPFFVQWQALGSGGRQDGTATRLARLIVMLLTWCCLLLGAAQPVWLGDPQRQTVSGREMLLAVDLSESMTMEDMQLSGQPAARIDAVKQVVSDFIARRQGDRVGLVLFGSQAFYHVPLTFDLNTLSTLLLEAQPGFAGQTTAIGDAIGISVKHLEQRPEQSRVVILLTDGANTAGTLEPVKAARLAATTGIRIYTVGVGATEMLVPGLFGSSLGARRVNPSADLDEDSLTQIAELTGGRYFRATDTEQLNDIYQLLDQLEPTGSDDLVFRPRASLAHWPLAAALLLSLLLALAQVLPSAARKPLFRLPATGRSPTTDDGAAPR